MNADASHPPSSEETSPPERTRKGAVQVLRADLGAALAEDSSLPVTLRRCGEALARHTGTSTCIWTLGPNERLRLEVRTPEGPVPDFLQPEVRLGEGPIGQLAQARRPSCLNLGTWELAGLPLVLGERLVGVVAALAPSPLPDGMLETLEPFADLLANGIERRRAELLLARRTEALTRVTKDLEQFAYAASHDLQEPLRMVSSYTQLLSRRYQGKLDATADEFIAFAVDGATRMRDLLNDLLAYSRVSTRGKEPSPTDCNAVLSKALASLQSQVARSDAQVTADPLPTVMADVSQLEHVFRNLLDNALKFRRAVPPQVHVSSRPHEDGSWLFEFRDNGIGLDVRHAERIFVIFQRLHSKDQYPGRGMGLALCKRIIERHGGRIWVESTPDQGSTFFFTLPAHGT